MYARDPATYKEFRQAEEGRASGRVGRASGEQIATGGGPRTLRESLSRFLSDVRFVMRGFRKRPAQGVLVALTLAVGLAANAAIFSDLNALRRPGGGRGLEDPREPRRFGKSKGRRNARGG